jgi:hypothetical protein
MTIPTNKEEEDDDDGDNTVGLERALHQVKRPRGVDNLQKHALSVTFLLYVAMLVFTKGTWN